MIRSKIAVMRGGGVIVYSIEVQAMKLVRRYASGTPGASGATFYKNALNLTREGAAAREARKVRWSDNS